MFVLSCKPLVKQSRRKFKLNCSLCHPEIWARAARVSAFPQCLRTVFTSWQLRIPTWPECCVRPAHPHFLSHCVSGGIQHWHPAWSIQLRPLMKSFFFLESVLWTSDKLCRHREYDWIRNTSAPLGSDAPDMRKSGRRGKLARQQHWRLDEAEGRCKALILLVRHGSTCLRLRTKSITFSSAPCSFLTTALSGLTELDWVTYIPPRL